MLHPGSDIDSEEPAGTSEFSWFQRALWGVAILVLGTAIGTRLARPEAVDPGHHGLSAQDLGSFVDLRSLRVAGMSRALAGAQRAPTGRGELDSQFSPAH